MSAEITPSKKESINDNWTKGYDVPEAIRQLKVGANVPFANIDNEGKKHVVYWQVLEVASSSTGRFRLKSGSMSYQPNVKTFLEGIDMEEISAATDQTMAIGGKNRRVERKKKAKTLELIEAWGGENLIELRTAAELEEIERRIKIAKDQDVRDVFEEKKKLLREDPTEYFYELRAKAKSKKDAEELQKIISGLKYVNSAEEEKSKLKIVPKKIEKVVPPPKPQESEMDRSNVLNIADLQQMAREADLEAERRAEERKVTPREMFSSVYGENFEAKLSIVEQLEKARDWTSAKISRLAKSGVELGMKSWKRWGRTIKVAMGAALLGASAYSEQATRRGIEMESHAGITSSAPAIKEARAGAKAREQKEQYEIAPKRAEIRTTLESAKKGNTDLQETIEKDLETQKAKRKVVVKKTVTVNEEFVGPELPTTPTRAELEDVIVPTDEETFVIDKEIEPSKVVTANDFHIKNMGPEIVETKNMPSAEEVLKKQIEETMQKTEKPQEHSTPKLEGNEPPKDIDSMGAKDVLDKYDDQRFFNTKIGVRANRLHLFRTFSRLEPKGKIFGFGKIETVIEYEERMKEKLRREGLLEPLETFLKKDEAI